MQASYSAIRPVAAVIVAAGLSRRMGTFKLTLPWGPTTVIEAVVETLSARAGRNPGRYRTPGRGSPGAAGAHQRTLRS